MKTAFGYWFGMVPLLVSLGGCAGTSRDVPARPATAQSPAAPDSSTALTVDGSPIRTSSLAATALEAAGAVAIEEAALDVLLEAEIKRAGITISETQVERERQLLFERVAAEAQVGEEQAGALIDRFRRSRGLGPIRFAAMLRRNAQLRTLVQEQAAAWEEPMRQMVTAELGPKARARLLVLPSPADAAAIRSQLESLPAGERSGTFARLAVERSRDSSAARGGLFGPASTGDLSIPPSIREFLSQPVGSISPVLAIDSGMAIVMIEEQIAAAPATQESQNAAQQKVRTRLEREAMDKLASELLAQARINVLDNAARWSWENRMR
jgi:hypothetical protein